MDITIILLIVNVFAAVAVIGLTLIQQPKGDMGSAFGGGGSQSMFGSRGSANFLTKSTSWMCFIFFASSLTLAYMYAQSNNQEGVVDQSVIEEVSDLPSIGEAAQAVDSSATELPELPVDEAAETMNQAVEAGAEVVEQVSDKAEDKVDEAADAVDSEKEAVNKPQE